MKFHITGISPLLMHADVMSNPLHPLKKLQASFTGKRKKTDEDHAEIARIDWTASLYYDEAVGVHVPGQNIERMLVDAAKLQKLGTAAKQGLKVIEPSPLLYNGPANPDALFQDLRFVDVRAVRNQQVRVMRCRPIFREWELEFDVDVDPDIFNDNVIEDIVQHAGKRIGLCDFRPRYGRFNAERVA